MRKFLLIGLIIISVRATYAQHSDLYIIKLRNGVTLKAELVKVVPDSFAIIRQYGLETKINISDILNINFNETNPTISGKKKRPKITKRNLSDSWTFGYQCGFTAGIVESFLTTSFTSRFTVLKKIAPKTQVGFSFGVDPYLWYSSLTIVPVTLDLRKYLYNMPRSPFAYCMAGYGFNILEKKPIQSGGILYGCGAGYSFRTRNQKVFSVMLGYKHQDAESKFNPGRNRPLLTEYIKINRMEARVECLF